MKFLVLNGPNLNMTGLRQPEIYGSETLADINREISQYCQEKGIACDFFQSNCEGEIITAIHRIRGVYDGCVINAGAYTHYSYAIRDAIACVREQVPFAEVHMSDIHSREPFRSQSVIQDVCITQISGHGKRSYLMGVDALARYLKAQGKNT
ncbi:MAG: type II 3-dehydroquinate dehydratase [Clostridiales bacterium]|nr:type II 3-dehydroquinate dehydratase [Clostridiales bacterium]